MRISMLRIAIMHLCKTTWNLSLAGSCFQLSTLPHSRKSLSHPRQLESRELTVHALLAQSDVSINQIDRL
jgi:hypothetical protein